ncbi:MULTISPECIES: NUDIX domain-containing protein [unclassified Streptomyces]|uniref:NUDIX hydrolase n=1 Tax=unclassified Streptomyces TaxID=2593676 RepID=UPI000CD58773|nr:MULTISPECIES: NUDIX domain-containing protein [unclassified Streptomyces]
MSTPEFIADLRRHVGTRLLFLPGVSTVVLDDAGRVLLGRRADTGRWALIAGLPEPGEQPADAAVREVYEETAVRCVPERVVSVQTMAPIRYENGDRCQYMDITLRCRAVGGEARVNDEESLDVGWFTLDGLPDSLSRGARERIHLAVTEGPTWFHPATGATDITALAADADGAEAGGGPG